MGFQAPRSPDCRSCERSDWAEIGLAHHSINLCDCWFACQHSRPRLASYRRNGLEYRLASVVCQLTTNWPLVIWAFAAVAMVIYALALPERYDIACAGYAFTLVVTLAISGVHSVPLLASRAWETVLGGTLGLAAATLLLPIHIPKRS